jgi:hypothetical protein
MKTETAKTPEGNQVVKAFTTKTQLVSEDSFITEDELTDFLGSILMDAGYEAHVLEGFLFLFKSIAEMANQDRIGLIDLCGHARRFIYKDTWHSNFSEDKYLDSIHKRYRETNWNYKTNTFVDDMRKEVFGETETFQPLEKPEEALFGDFGTNAAPKYSREFYFNQMAEKLVAVLEHPEVSAETKNTLLLMVDSVVEDSEINNDTPHYIRTRFPKAMLAQDEGYAEATMKHLETVMEEGIADEIYMPIVKENIGR